MVMCELYIIYLYLITSLLMYVIGPKVCVKSGHYLHFLYGGFILFVSASCSSFKTKHICAV